MLNSPTLCQYFVQQPLGIICKQFPQPIIYHYMDDILFAHPDINYKYHGKNVWWREKKKKAYLPGKKKKNLKKEKKKKKIKNIK